MFINVEAQTGRAPCTQRAARLIPATGRLSALSKSSDIKRVEGSIAHCVAALDRPADKKLLIGCEMFSWIYTERDVFLTLCAKALRFIGCFLLVL